MKIRPMEPEIQRRNYFVLQVMCSQFLIDRNQTYTVCPARDGSCDTDEQLASFTSNVPTDRSGHAAEKSIRGMCKVWSLRKTLQ